MPQFPTPEATAPLDTPREPKYIEYLGVDPASVREAIAALAPLRVGRPMDDTETRDFVNRFMGDDGNATVPDDSGTAIEVFPGEAIARGQLRFENGDPELPYRNATIAVVANDESYVDPYLYLQLSLADSTEAAVLSTDDTSPSFGLPGVGLIRPGDALPISAVNADDVSAEVWPVYEVTDAYEILARVHDTGPPGVCASAPCPEVLESSNIGVSELRYEIAAADGSLATPLEEATWTTAIHCLHPAATTVIDIYDPSLGTTEFLYNITRMRSRSDGCLNGTDVVANVGSVSTAMLDAAKLDIGRDYRVTVIAIDYACYRSPWVMACRSGCLMAIAEVASG